MELNDWAGRAKRKYHRIAHRLKGRPGERYLACADYRKENPAKWRSAFPETKRSFANPRHYGPLPDAFWETVRWETPEMGVLELPGGKLHDQSGWVLTPDDRWLPEFSRYGLEEASRRRFQLPYPSAIRLPGRVLSLASDWADENGSHFLLDSMGRLAVYEKCGISFDAVDYVCLSQPRLPTSRFLLSQIPIPAEKIIWSQPGTLYEAEILLAATCPARSANPAPWQIEWLRKKFGGPVVRSERRIYLTRKGLRRSITNEEEICSILQAHDFEFVDLSQVANPVALFAEAAFVVAAHGAGLAFTTFCQPGTTVFELFSSEYLRSTFYVLAQSGGLSYACMVGPCEKKRAANDLRKSTAGFWIDPVLFRHALACEIERRESL